MDIAPLAAFFEKNLTIVFFIYGLSFFFLAAGAGLRRVPKRDLSSVLPENYPRYLVAGAYAMGLYAVFSGLVAAKSAFLLAPYFNQELFLKLTGVPIQILRAVAAFILSYAVIRSLALRLTYKMMAILMAFVALPFISLYSGYVSLKVMLVN